MKIESQIYTRYLTEPPALGKQKGSSREVEAKKVSAVPNSQIRAAHKTGTTQSVAPAHKAKMNNMPSALSDVITAEERAMLQQVFPEKGAKWGATAYKSAEFSLNNLSVGHKLDLMS